MYVTYHSSEYNLIAYCFGAPSAQKTRTSIKVLFCYIVNKEVERYIVLYFGTFVKTYPVHTCFGEIEKFFLKNRNNTYVFLSRRNNAELQ